MNDVINEINDRLNNIASNIDMEIKEPNIIVKDYQYYENIKLEQAPSLVEALKTNNSKEVVDDFTGEICRFRTPYCLGSYCHKEVCTEPTETDSKMYEPLETTIEKCSRAPALRALMKNQMLFSDGTPNPDLDKDFDETMTSGYDIADASESMQKIGEAIATPKTKSEAKRSDANEVSQGKTIAE